MKNQRGTLLTSVLLVGVSWLAVGSALAQVELPEPPSGQAATQPSPQTSLMEPDCGPDYQSGGAVPLADIGQIEELRRQNEADLATLVNRRAQERRLADLTAETEQLKAELSAARADGQAAVARRAALEQRIAQLESALATPPSDESEENTVAEVAPLQEAQAELLSRITSLEARSAQDGQAIETLRADLIQATKAEQAAVKAIAILQDREDALREQLSRAGNRLNQQQAQLALAQSNAQAAQQQLMNQSAGITALEAERDRLQADLIAVTAAARAAGEERVQLLQEQLNETSEMRARFTQYQTRATEALEAERARSATREARLSDQLARARARLQAARAELDAALVNNAAASDGLSAALVDVDAARSEAGQLSLQLEQAQTEITRLKGIVLTQSAELQKLRRGMVGARLVAKQARSRLAICRRAQRSAESEMNRLRAVRSTFNQALSESTAEGGTALAMDIAHSEALSISSDVLFASGSARLSAAGKMILAELVEPLNAAWAELPDQEDWVLSVEGHADKVPIRRSRYRSNRELSVGRAIAVASELVGDSDLGERDLLVSGFGEFRPVDPADTAEAYAKNRRVELRLVRR